MKITWKSYTTRWGGWLKQPVTNTISAKCKAVISSYLISYASCIIREKQVSISFLYILHQQTWSFSKSCNGTNELICENCIYHERIKEISFIVQIAVFSNFLTRFLWRVLWNSTLPWFFNIGVLLRRTIILWNIICIFEYHSKYFLFWLSLENIILHYDQFILTLLLLEWKGIRFDWFLISKGGFPFWSEIRYLCH